MLRFYHRQGDTLSAVTVPHVAEPPELPASPLWIDVMTPVVEEDGFIERLTGLDLPTREEMQEIEISSRFYRENGAEYMTVTLLAPLEPGDSNTTAVTFILAPTCLITLRYAELKGFQYYAARVQKDRDPTLCASPERVMLGLIGACIDRAADMLEKETADIDAISRSVFRPEEGTGAAASSNKLQAVVERIGIHGEVLTKMRDSFVSISRLLTFHMTLEGASDKIAAQRIKILRRDVDALSDHSNFLSNKLSFLLDATLGLINLQQNQIIKIFSVAAVVFLPPTLIASIYGMNFTHMPELTWQYGFVFALVLMLGSAVLPYYYFKHRGWL